jgi:hypothetical protein
MRLRRLRAEVSLRAAAFRQSEGGCLSGQGSRGPARPLGRLLRRRLLASLVGFSSRSGADVDVVAIFLVGLDARQEIGVPVQHRAFELRVAFGSGHER